MGILLSWVRQSFLIYGTNITGNNKNKKHTTDKLDFIKIFCTSEDIIKNKMKKNTHKINNPYNGRRYFQIMYLIKFYTQNLLRTLTTH